MKKEFSKAWKASKQSRKQRKYKAMAHIMIKHKMMSAHLSKELRQKYGRRSVPLRKGDFVKVMNGEFKGKEGKVSIIDSRNARVAIEGIQIQKKDGTKVNRMINASNLLVKELNLEDKKRLRKKEQEVKK